jgi:hypothetical protein
LNIKLKRWGKGEEELVRMICKRKEETEKRSVMEAAMLVLLEDPYKVET